MKAAARIRRDRYCLPDVRPGRSGSAFPAVPKWSIKKWIGMPDETRPLILCEYAHAMGNSFGGFAKYWQAFRSHPRLQGLSGTGSIRP
jgi:beta-galactosidase/beta-glucuronidase